MTCDDVVELLGGYRIRYRTERLMQDDIERILTAAKVPFKREFRLDSGPIDFRLECGIGIECKIGSGPSAVLDQLLRYAEAPEITGIVLVTSRHTHASTAETLCDKPFRIHWVAGQL